MHTTLSSARASVRSNLSIALLTCFLIAQVAMGDMHDPRDERIATLRTWFHVNSPDGPVDEEGIQEFLDALKEVHFIDAVAADGSSEHCYYQQWIYQQAWCCWSHYSRTG
jgi:hypothetical protein